MTDFDELIRRSLHDMAGEAGSFHHPEHRANAEPREARSRHLGLLGVAAVIALIAISGWSLRMIDRDPESADSEPAATRIEPYEPQCSSSDPRATATTDPGAASGTEEDVLLAAREAVSQLHSLDIENAPGFAGLRMDLAEHAVTVSWKGDPPQAVIGLMEEFRDQSVVISIEHASFDASDLRNAAAAISRELHGIDDLSVSGVAADDNYRGVCVLVAGPGADDVDRRRWAAEKLKSTTGLPIAVVKSTFRSGAEHLR